VSSSSALQRGTYTDDHSLGSLSLTPLRPNTSTEDRKWDLCTPETISLKGAHGEEIVRDILLLTQVSSLYHFDLPSEAAVLMAKRIIVS